MPLKETYIPHKLDEVKARKVTFEALNAYITSRNGWVTSIPGAVEVTMQCLVDSTLPTDLRARGYRLVEDGETERILPHVITERLCMGADGAMEPLTAGSARPVTLTVTHAGICKVKKYALFTH